MKLKKKKKLRNYFISFLYIAINYILQQFYRVVQLKNLSNLLPTIFKFLRFFIIGG